MGKLADELNAHLQAPGHALPAALSPEERKAQWYALCIRFENLRREVIFPAMGEAQEALQRQGRRAQVFLDRSETYRGSGGIPAVLEFDTRPMRMGEEGEPLECRMVFRLDSAQQLVCIERSQGGVMQWAITDALMVKRDNASGSLSFVKTDQSAWLGRESYLPVDALTPERVGEEILSFVKATTGS
jgi:hypothetical protein